MYCYVTIFQKNLYIIIHFLSTYNNYYYNYAFLCYYYHYYLLQESWVSYDISYVRPQSMPLSMLANTEMIRNIIVRRNESGIN